MSTTISHRTNIFNDLIKEGEKAFKIAGKINNSLGKMDITLDYRKGKFKTAKAAFESLLQKYQKFCYLVPDVLS